MPKCGSQILICDLPVRFDTYIGCSHACKYCFANRNYNIANVKIGETYKQLEKWINGERTTDTEWCDWNIPLHWGGLSDPFQPIERVQRESLKCLEIFKETQYPFIVSTKNALIASEPYLSLIKECNCVVQFSASCREHDAIETGASTFEERLDAARKIAEFKRVNIRVQPYIPKLFKSVLKSIDEFADAGVHGVIFEAMKYFQKRPSTIKLGNDFVYPTKLLKPQFEIFRDKCHSRGMKFYCGENRLRNMGDSLCCCGVDGMGWRVNTANLNHYLFDKDSFVITETMKKASPQVMKSLHQDNKGTLAAHIYTFGDMLEQHLNSKRYAKVLLEDELTKKI